MSQIEISNITNRTGTTGSVIVGLTSSLSAGYAKLPSGNNSERVGIESGSIRYNSTAKLLEFYDGTQWNFILPAEESTNAIAVHSIGYSWTEVPDLNYITISTTGDAAFFGNLSSSVGNNSSCSSNTRGVYGGGNSPANVIEYITLATTGNVTDFGDLITPRNDMGACSSSTRGIFAGGQNPPGPSSVNNIDYITIATTGNTNDFGDLSAPAVGRYGLGGCSSSTRGILVGGYSGTFPAGTEVNVIDYITIATLSATATDFGDLIRLTSYSSACSSSTRGIFGGGYTPATTEGYNSYISYVTIATTGNAIYFGELSSEKASLAAASSSTRGVFFGGYGPPYPGLPWNTIEYVTIATTGNALDFGDLLRPSATYGQAACSNNHGGLL